MKGKSKFLILILVLLIIASALIMVSCNKSKNNPGSTSSDEPGGEIVVPGEDINFTVYFYYLPTDQTPYTEISVVSGQKIKISDIPLDLTREGYKFGGWYKDTSCTNEFNTNSVINKDIKLYALWIAPFTMSFYIDNYDNTPIKTLKYYSNEIVNPQEIIEPTKDSYEFVGWYLDKEYTQRYEYSEHLQNSISLYAKWDSTFAKIQFVTNTKFAHIETVTVEKDKPYTLPIPTIQPDPPADVSDITFEAWCTDKALTQLVTGAAITIYDNTILYAKWDFSTHTHSFETEASIFKEANCTEAGGRACCCEICGYYESEEVIPPLGHNIYEREWLDGGTYHYHRCLRCDEQCDKQSHTFNNGEITQNPTCTEAGVKTYSCTCCSAAKTEEIAALGHDINESKWETDGEHHWHACNHEGCEEHFDEQNHNKVRDEAKDHTSTGCSDPTVVGYKCSICDADLSERSESIPHTFNENEYQHNETQHWHVCSVCSNNIEYEDHDYDIHTDPATCTSTGLRTYTCKKCGYTKQEVIPKAAHQLLWADATMDITDEQKALLDTYHFRICKNCHKVFDESKEEHNIDWTDTKPGGTVRITVQSTCTTHGTADVYCPVCGQQHKGVEVPLKDHTWEEDGHVDSGCLTPGYTHYTCSKCGQEKREDIPAAHRYALTQVIAQTCTHEGTSVYECVECGDIKTEVIPAGHTYFKYETNDTHHWHICEVCHDTIDYAPHEFEVIMMNTPTSCGDEAYIMYRCIHCAYSYEEVEVGFGHEWDKGTIIAEPSCTEPGYKEYTCLKCGEIKTETFGEPLGHSWNEGVETTHPTCEHTGIKTYTCTRCGETRTEVVPIKDHDWKEISKVDSTCTALGTITYECSMCHRTKTEDIPMKPHEYNPDDPDHHNIITYPTCTEKGLEEFLCIHCGHQVTQEIDALGHDYHNTVTPPTCTEEGYTTHTCSRCDHSYRDTFVPATGHTWDSGEITTEPTCTATGVKTYTCTVCGATKTESVAKTPHEYSTTWTYEDEEHDSLRCIHCGNVSQTREHDYDGYCCKYCHHHLLDKYITKFTTYGSIASNPVIIQSEEEFVLFLDYIFSNYITTIKYYKFGGAFETYLLSEYSNLTKETTHVTILKRYIKQVTMPSIFYAYSFNSTQYSMGIKWYLKTRKELTPQEYAGNTYGYGLDYFSLVDSCYDDNFNENAIQQDYYFSEYSSTRTNSFDAFKYKEYTGTFDCITSDQIVYALQNYLKPNCSGRALTLLNRAKAILREIVDDSMSDVEKVKAIYKWLVSNVTYDKAVLNEGNDTDISGNGWVQYASWFAEGALEYGYAVCDGISKAFTILTGLEGIRSVRITSTAKEHAWNKVFVDTNGDGVGEWYVVDATWANTYIESETVEMFNAKYLFTTDAQREAEEYVGENFLDIEATISYNYYATETFTYNSTEYDLFIINAQELQVLIDYLNEHDEKTTTYKTVSVFIAGSLELPGGISYVYDSETDVGTISGVQGKYYIIIIS